MAGNNFPKGGYKVLPVRLNFGTLSLVSDDLSNELMNSGIDQIAAVYVDNSLNQNPLTLVFNSLQNLVILPGRQGIYPVIVNQGGLPFTGATTATAGLLIQLIFMNYAPTFAEWGT